MTPKETLDWLAQQHFDQCREERPIQDWIRKMKSQLPKQPDLDAICQDLQEKTYNQAMRIAELEAQLAQPASYKQELSSVTYKEVVDTMNALYAGDSKQVQIATALESKKLYTTPPHSFFEDVADELRVEIAELQDQIRLLEKQLAQRTWVGLTDGEKRVIVTNNRSSSGAMMDTIAKLKEKNT